MTDLKNKLEEVWIQRGSFGYVVVKDKDSNPEWINRPIQVCSVSILYTLQEELHKTREDIKNGYHEAYGLDSDLTIDELRDRVRLMHSWVKQHQYAVESFNNIKNQEIKTLKERLEKCENSLMKVACFETHGENKYINHEQAFTGVANFARQYFQDKQGK